jgi:hypothetical protein
MAVDDEVCERIVGACLQAIAFRLACKLPEWCRARDQEQKLRLQAGSHKESESIASTCHIRLNPTPAEHLFTRTPQR